MTRMPYVRSSNPKKIELIAEAEILASILRMSKAGVDNEMIAANLLAAANAVAEVSIMPTTYAVVLTTIATSVRASAKKTRN